jgi:type III restriction enzyme
MKQVVIENPIINSPFEEPRRHFKFDTDGITDEILESRRISHYFIPIAQPKKKGKQLNLDLGGLTQDRVEENKFINQIRERVKLWRRGGYLGVTSTTRKLLEYWTNSERDRRLFFCQIEALETLITNYHAFKPRERIAAGKLTIFLVGILVRCTKWRGNFSIREVISI